MAWYPKHPPEVRARVERLIRTTTLTFTEIAKAEGVPWPTVTGWARKLPEGSYPRRPGRNETTIAPEQVARIVAARQSGMQWQAIATEHGVHVTTVRKFYKREVPVEKHYAPPPEPAPADPTTSLVKRLRREGWDDAFIVSTLRNHPRLSVAAQVSA